VRVSSSNGEVPKESNSARPCRYDLLARLKTKENFLLRGKRAYMEGKKGGCFGHEDRALAKWEE